MAQTRYGRLQASWLFVGVLAPALTGCHPFQRHDQIVLSGGSVGSSSDLMLRNGATVLRSDTIGVLFGPTIQQGAVCTPCYVVLLKYPHGPLVSSARTTSQADGARASAITDVTVNGRSITLDYRVTGEPAGKTPASETLTANGKSLSLAAGAVILADVTGQTVTWRQISTPLPAVPYDADTATAEATAKTVTGQLAQRSPEVHAFVQ